MSFSILSLRSILVVAALLCSVLASPIEKRSQCANYTIIDIRGTFEMQGASKAFVTMNNAIFDTIPGGKQYSAVYPAAIDQNSTEASWDTINMIHAGLATDPAMCFFLEGYSQGAVAVVNTLRQLTGSSYNAVKGIFVVGNLVHKSGLSCNTDSSGGTSTRFVNGISNNPGIPLNWVYKSLDVCAYGDPLCDTLHPANIIQHTTYPNDPRVQYQGSKFAITRLLLG